MKKMRNEIRAVELQKYLKTLADLQANGFNCKAEIQVAIKALHEAMGFSTVVSSKPTHIVVLEKNFEGVIKSVDIFANLLGAGITKVRRLTVGDSHELRNGIITVSIMNANNLDSIRDTIRGWSADYIINNSIFPLSTFDIKIKD